MADKRFKLSFMWQIFLALALGIIAGCCMTGIPEVAETYIKPFGTIFLNLLKFIVVPLVLFSIICGIISMNDVKKIGKLGLRTLVYFMATTIFAVALGLVVSTFCKGWFPKIDIPVAEAVAVPELSLLDQIVSFFPRNIIEPLAENLMMPVIVIAIFFGIATVHVGEKAKAAEDFSISMNEVIQKILSYIMAAVPIGVFCMLTPVVAVNGPKVLGSYAVLIGVNYLCFFIHAILVYTTCVATLGKYSPREFFRKLLPAMLFAFSSDSSVATLPTSMKCTQDMGVRKDVGSFVLSLGATINMDGVAIYLGVISVFMAYCCGIDLTFNQYLAIALTSTIASIGTPGIPGGSLALMATVFASAGIPVECVAIAAGIDRIVDMGRTTMSVTGDASCAVIMQHFENRDNK